MGGFVEVRNSKDPEVLSSKATPFLDGFAVRNSKEPEVPSSKATPFLDGFAEVRNSNKNQASSSKAVPFLDDFAAVRHSSKELEALSSGLVSRESKDSMKDVEFVQEKEQVEIQAVLGSVWNSAIEGRSQSV